LDAEDVSLAIKYATLDEFQDARKIIAKPWKSLSRIQIL